MLPCADNDLVVLDVEENLLVEGDPGLGEGVHVRYQCLVLWLKGQVKIMD